VHGIHWDKRREQAKFGDNLVNDEQAAFIALA